MKPLPRFCLIGMIAVFAPVLCRAQGYTITTVAGGGGSTADGGPATKAYLHPAGLALDSAGNLYIADDADNLIRMVTPAGIISTVAGTTNLGLGYSGDGGPAISAQLNAPDGVAVDSAGNLYISDSGNGRVRMVTPDGTISTVAGGGFPPIPSVGDGGPATSAALASPEGLAFDSGGNLYIADSLGNRVRMVTPDGTISTVAGGVFSLNIGDGGPATKAALNQPTSVAVDPSGNLYIANAGNNRIRMVSTSGIITTVAGSGSGSYSGDGGPAASAGLSTPIGVAVDSASNLYIADSSDQRVRMVTPDGTISTIAGNGTVGNSGDGGPALNAEFNYPTLIALDGSGNIYVSDSFNYTVRLLTVNVQ